MLAFRSLLAPVVLIPLALGCEATSSGTTRTDSVDPLMAEEIEATTRLDRAGTTTEGERITTVLVEFEAVGAEQREDVWCWAACTQMIQGFNDVPSTQEEIAARIHGVGEDGSTKVEAASFYEIMCALNPDLPNDQFEAVWSDIGAMLEQDPELLLDADLEFDTDKLAGAALEQYVPNKTINVGELVRGHPAVVGLRDDPESAMGHAYVLYGATYSMNDNAGMWGKTTEAVGGLFGQEDVASVLEQYDPGDCTIHEVQLVDPLVGEGQAMSMDDFMGRVDFVVTQSQARQVLLKWQQVAAIEAND